MDLHHVALMAIGESYALIPPGPMPNVADAAQLAVGAMGRGFALAVKISAPFIVFGFLFNLGLGILSRLMPQMQVFFLAMPLAILLGLVVLLAVLGAMMGVFLEDLGRFLNGFGSR
jgi:flagellar biosynthetic protein FliR